MPQSRIITSAKVILYVNGHPYAQVQHFRWEAAEPKKAIYGLDSGEPYELAPTTTKVSGTVGLIRLSGDGGLEGAGITPEISQIPRGKYFSMMLVDRSTDTQIFRADSCSVTSQSWDVPAKGIVTGSMSFEGLKWGNESQDR